jgi:hypothetical protein
MFSVHLTDAYVLHVLLGIEEMDGKYVERSGCGLH